MGKRSAKAQETRTGLLETDGKLFRAQGFHATGLDEVLRESGTPKGSLYHYFPGGKDQLAIETLRHVAGQLEQRMSALLRSNSDPLKSLRTLFDFTAKTLPESEFRDGCPIAAVTLDVASDRESIRYACEQGFQTWLQVFVQHFCRAGLSKTRSKALATVVLASLEGALILSRAQKNVEPLTIIQRELVTLIESSIART